MRGTDAKMFQTGREDEVRLSADAGPSLPVSPGGERVPAVLYSAAPWGSLTGGPLCALDHLAAMAPDFQGTLVLCEHGPLEEVAQTKGISVWCSPIFTGLRHAGFRRFFLHAWKVACFRFRYVRNLSRLLRQRPGILHIHCRDVHLPYALFAAKLAGVPLTMTLHETWMNTFTEWWHLALMRLFRVPVVCLSRAMVEQYPSLLRVAAVIPNAVRSFPPIPRRDVSAGHVPVVGMVGSMVPEKGVFACLNVCRLLKERGIPFEMRLIGLWKREEFRREADEFIVRQGLGGQVKILGEIHSGGRIYGDLDVFFLPTRRDSFPRVVMEAMSHGLPVVATRVDGIPEMVEDGVSGLLVPPGDAQGYAAALERLLLDATLREQMGRDARKRAEALFSPEAYRERFLAFYESLPGGRRLGGGANGAGA